MLLISILFTNLTFGQLVSGYYHDLIIFITENGKDYEKINSFYKMYNDEDTFSLTQGKHERLIEPKKNTTYLIDYKKNNLQIAIYLYIPFEQKDDNLGFEMSLINEITFDITDLDNGTYFINYSKGLYLAPNSYEANRTGEDLLSIWIPPKTLKKCKISDEFIPKENYSKIETNKIEE